MFWWAIGLTVILGGLYAILLVRRHKKEIAEYHYDPGEVEDIFYHEERRPQIARGNTSRRTYASKVRKYEKIDTKFGVVTVFERKDGKITVLIDDDITATFNEKEFFEDFVL